MLTTTARQDSRPDSQTLVLAVAAETPSSHTSAAKIRPVGCVAGEDGGWAWTALVEPHNVPTGKHDEFKRADTRLGRWRTLDTGHSVQTDGQTGGETRDDYVIYNHDSRPTPDATLGGRPQPET